MLKILFSPSEGKNSGGTANSKELLGATHARDEILKAYNTVVSSQNEKEIEELFGIKKFSDCQKYIVDIFNAPVMPALERYQGVAYDYLEYPLLSKIQQEYLKKNSIIFSNLYGPIYGGDMIPIYKVKQGNSIGGIAPDKFYKERFSYQLDLLLGSDDILDLRAGYYDKFYKISRPYTTLKFLKNGKTLSHWAKAYRGIVLKELAKANVESLEAFMQLEIAGLQVKEIQVIKNKTQIIYDIQE